MVYTIANSNTQDLEKDILSVEKCQKNEVLSYLLLREMPIFTE